ncbi:fasciclin domain-containing protein [Lutibacter sp. HS1-25]|uniref:fasciclin domain-containing protein n=1 Tax=Lutibacter sp. HS1-25 TaxID=2485000 RepID=UPI0013E95DCB|nr:fasciclin domain-containing protein [Lutibacter sp. HS1-25]
MKFIKLKTLRIVGMISLILSLTACDLGLQESFDFDPEVDLSDPLDKFTAWEWIQTKDQLTTDGKFDGEQFNYFIAAIKAAGMEAEYSGANKNRTYLLLNNNAFTGTGDIIHIVTGKSSVPAGETPDQTMARADIEKLRTILKYHIVTTYIAQVPTLEERDVDYLFQTMIPGEDGLIAFRRDVLYRVTINREPAPLPDVATKEWEAVRSHNYVFNNGVGHVIADPVRNKPY